VSTVNDKGDHARVLLAPRGDNLLMIIGAPRSGTTWIAKLFDSHPDVCYRHEPDTILRDSELPVLCSSADFERYRIRAQGYLESLAEVRTLKSAGSLPLFSKKYRTRSGNLQHALIVHGVRSLQAATRGSAWSKRMQIPDLFSPGSSPRLVVMKSVSARGRIGLFARAMPECRIVFVIRHPCGQVNSTLRGIRSGRFERRIPFEEILQTSEAQEAGLSAREFHSLDVVEQCAWHWAILNQKAANDLAGLTRIRTVSYDEVCLRPREASRELLALAGLDWTEHTNAFVTRSTTSKDSNRYYLITRDSLAAADKWRSQLAPDDQARILAIARRVPTGISFAV